MEVYSFIVLFFVIGFLGIIAVSKKQKSSFDAKKQFTKFFVYLILVLVQMVFIEFKLYSFFSIFIIVLGLHEIFKIRKSLESFVLGISFFLIFGFFYYTFFKELNVNLQQFLFLLVITFDGYSQLSGQLFGRTKLFPKTSPNKTFEGFLGGFGVALITAYFTSAILNIDTKLALIYAVLICAFSVMGDFLASAYKRFHLVKDFSNLIPAHGGILDRFDSLIFASFGFYFVANINFNSNVLTLSLYGIVFLIIFLIGEFGFHSLKCKVEISRKWVHFSSGICCLTVPFFIDNHWLVLLLTGSFVVILILSKKFNFLKSINSIERKSFGSILFPMSIYFSFLNFQIFNFKYLYFYLPILILSVCDPIAALIGKKWPLGKYKIGENHKTIVGSIGFFISSFILVLITLIAFDLQKSTAEIIAYCLLISTFSTITEALSKNGIDNITIPFCVLCCLLLLN